MRRAHRSPSLLTADFYGAYLDDALRKGLAKLRI
jgi:hypothetical protein